MESKKTENGGVFDRQSLQPNGPPLVRKIDRYINKMSLVKSPDNEDPVNIASEESEGSACAYYVVGKNRVEKIQQLPCQHLKPDSSVLLDTASGRLYKWGPDSLH